MPRRDRPRTPDGRYYVSRGRLKRCTDPALPDPERRAAIKALMQARMAVKTAQGEALADARDRVDAAKRTLGERGPVWWTDGAPDEEGLDPQASSYAEWWAGLTQAERDAGM